MAIVVRGQRRAVGSPGGMPSLPANFAQPQGEGLGPALGQIGQALANAEARVASRQDAVDRAIAVGQSATFFDQSLAAAEQTGDIASRGSIANLNRAWDEHIAETVANYPGGQEASLQLREQLEKERAKYLGQAATRAQQASKQRVTDLLGERMNGYRAQVAADPSAMLEMVSAMETDLADLADAQTPGEEQAHRTAGRSMLAEAAVGSFLARGDLEGAEEVLNTPGFVRFLDETAQRRVFDTVARYRSARDEATMTIKGVPAHIFHSLTQPQQLSILGATPPRERLVEVGDDTSPTGSRFVPESQAMGAPGRPRSPLVEVRNEMESEFMKGVGKADADIVSSVRERAQNAPLIIAETTRMKAAMESGRFTTGALAPLRQQVARFAQFFGASPELQAMIGDAATADTLDAAAATLGVTVAQDMGRVTNMALGFIERSLPALIRTPEGNEILAEVVARKAERDQQIEGLMDSYIEKGSFRPEGEPTFYQAVRDLDAEDPIISPELRERIASAAEAAPPKLSDVFERAEAGEAPEGIDVPQGFSFVGMTEDGRARIKDDTTGRIAIESEEQAAARRAAEGEAGAEEVVE